MAKKEIFDHPVAGPLMRGMKHISVDRSNGAPSFHAALKALHHGEIVGVFPEATISQSFELKDMKSGVVRLAIESGAPVLPTVIWGSQRIWTKKVPRNFKRAGTPIYVSIGAPIFFSKEDDPEIGLARVKKEMANLLGEVQSQYPDSYLGERWAPARLGGTAPTPEMVELEKRNRQKREEI
jgi:1-acyl-sn-glycerol-3-phosphate acyltransferase